jgi:hypothetical protein
MARTVFIFGAGASAHLGVPLMKDIIDAADDLRQRQDVDQESFRLFFDLIQNRLPQLHAKSVVDLSNIESVFSLVEMGRLVGRLPGTAEEDVPAMAKAIRRVLAQTVEETCLFSVDGGEWRPSAPYLSIAQQVESARHAGTDGSVAMITLNYDLGLDFALHWSNLPIEYGLQPSMAHQAATLLKLHGSLNWTACNVCRTVRPVTLDQVFQLEGKRRFRAEKHRLPLRSSRCLSNLGSHCTASPLDGEPALVPPSWNKTQYHESFSNVWRHAARELSEAQDVRVIGYSLPESDAFFRDLLALGLAGSARLRSFTVVDPSEQVAKRFRELLGPDAKGRFHHEPVRFEEYANTVLKPSKRDRSSA